MIPAARPTLSVVAIARNEMRDLPGFLRNVRGVADEIVIVDDGSTDGTVDYLRSASADVKFLERRMTDGGFADQRNFGAANANGDWILHMDIDERITKQLAEEIRAVLPGTGLNAFRYRRLNFFLHRPFRAGGYESWNAAQLARRGSHRFKNVVHEMVEVDGGDKETGQLRSEMWHLNDSDFQERMRKNLQYAPKVAEAIAIASRVTWWRLLLIPLLKGLKTYFPGGAWRHGELGLLFSLYAMSGTFNSYAIAWDRQNGIDRLSLENSSVIGTVTEPRD